MEINVKDARSRLRELLDRVEEGDEVVILRHGKEVARLIPPHRGGAKRLPSLKGFRDTIRVSGEPLSRVAAQGRREERY